MHKNQNQLPEQVDLALGEIIEKTKPVFGEALDKIVLYGSYARGDYDQESDIDVIFFVTKADPNSFSEAISDIIWPLDLKYEVVISEMVQSTEHFQKHLDILPFYQHIQQEGVVLYGE